MNDVDLMKLSVMIDGYGWMLISSPATATASALALSSSSLHVSDALSTNALDETEVAVREDETIIVESFFVLIPYYGLFKFIDEAEASTWRRQHLTSNIANTNINNSSSFNNRSSSDMFGLINNENENEDLIADPHLVCEAKKIKSVIINGRKDIDDESLISILITYISHQDSIQQQIVLQDELISTSPYHTLELLFAENNAYAWVSALQATYPISEYFNACVKFGNVSPDNRLIQHAMRIAKPMDSISIYEIDDDEAEQEEQQGNPKEISFGNRFRSLCSFLHASSKFIKTLSLRNFKKVFGASIHVMGDMNPYENIDIIKYSFIPALVDMSQTIDLLVLSDNIMTDDVCTLLFQSLNRELLSHSRYLEGSLLNYLDLSGNLIGNDGIYAISEFISKSSHESLEVLHLQHNYITSAGFSVLVQSISSCLRIRDIDVSYNPIGTITSPTMDSVNGLEMLCKILPGLHQLNRLNMSSCKLKDDGQGLFLIPFFHSIASSLISTKGKIIIDLTDNDFSETAVNHFNSLLKDRNLPSENVLFGTMIASSFTTDNNNGTPNIFGNDDERVTILIHFNTRDLSMDDPFVAPPVDRIIDTLNRIMNINATDGEYGNWITPILDKNEKLFLHDPLALRLYVKDLLLAERLILIYESHAHDATFSILRIKNITLEKGFGSHSRNSSQVWTSSLSISNQVNNSLNISKVSTSSSFYREHLQETSLIQSSPSRPLTDDIIKKMLKAMLYPDNDVDLWNSLTNQTNFKNEIDLLLSFVDQYSINNIQEEGSPRKRLKPLSPLLQNSLLYVIKNANDSKALIKLQLTFASLMGDNHRCATIIAHMEQNQNYDNIEPKENREYMIRSSCSNLVRFIDLQMLNNLESAIKYCHGLRSKQCFHATRLAQIIVNLKNRDKYSRLDSNNVTAWFVELQKFELFNKDFIPSTGILTSPVTVPYTSFTRGVTSASELIYAHRKCATQISVLIAQTLSECDRALADIDGTGAACELIGLAIANKMIPELYCQLIVKIALSPSERLWRLGILIMLCIRVPLNDQPWNVTLRQMILNIFKLFESQALSSQIRNYVKISREILLNDEMDDDESWTYPSHKMKMFLSKSILSGATQTIAVEINETMARTYQISSICTFGELLRIVCDDLDKDYDWLQNFILCSRFTNHSDFSPLMPLNPNNLVIQWLFRRGVKREDGYEPETLVLGGIANSNHPRIMPYPHALSTNILFNQERKLLYWLRSAILDPEPIAYAAVLGLISDLGGIVKFQDMNVESIHQLLSEKYNYSVYIKREFASANGKSENLEWSNRFSSVIYQMKDHFMNVHPSSVSIFDIQSAFVEYTKQWPLSSSTVYPNIEIVDLTLSDVRIPIENKYRKNCLLAVNMNGGIRLFDSIEAMIPFWSSDISCLHSIKILSHGRRMCVGIDTMFDNQHDVLVVKFPSEQACQSFYRCIMLHLTKIVSAGEYMYSSSLSSTTHMQQFRYHFPYLPIPPSAPRLLAPKIGRIVSTDAITANAASEIEKDASIYSLFTWIDMYPKETKPTVVMYQQNSQIIEDDHHSINDAAPPSYPPPPLSPPASIS